MATAQTPVITNEWSLNGRRFKVEVFDHQDFAGLEPIKQVYALLINDKDQVAVVLNKSNLWILPGGGTEPGETSLDTLVREIKEETNCDVDPNEAIPFFFQTTFELFKDGTQGIMRYELRYVIPVKHYREFIEDPDNGDTLKVEWIPVNQIIKYLDWWKETAAFIQKRLPAYIGKLRS